MNYTFYNKNKFLIKFYIMKTIYTFFSLFILTVLIGCQNEINEITEQAEIKSEKQCYFTI